MIISIILGLLLISCGLCIRAFKMYGFIKEHDILIEDRKKYVDIEKMSRTIGLFLYSVGIFTIVLGFCDSFLILIIYVLYILLGVSYLSRFYDEKYKLNKDKKTKKTKGY